MQNEPVLSMRSSDLERIKSETREDAVDTIIVLLDFAHIGFLLGIFADEPAFGSALEYGLGCGEEKDSVAFP